MRILTLLVGENSLAPAAALTAEIRTFNREIDFRLRFLHIEIEEVHAAPSSLLETAARKIDRIDLREVKDGDVLDTAARLALLLQGERPDLFILVGGDTRSAGGATAAGAPDLVRAGLAAARVCGIRAAAFQASFAPAVLAAGGVDLGPDAGAAVAAMSGVAREIS